MSLLDDVSIVVTPNGYKAGTLYGVLPVPTEGSEEITNYNLNGNFSDTSALHTWISAFGGSFAPSTGVNDGSIRITSNGGIRLNGIYMGVVVGKLYKVSVLASTNTGTALLNCSGDLTNFTLKQTVTTTPTTFDFYVTYSSYISFFANLTSNILTLDDISVKEWTASDMDVTRATAATRVDENGLVNYAEVLGSELVSCGSFDCADPDAVWNRGTGWTISGGKATQSSGNGQLSQTGILIADKTYSVTVVIDSINVGGELNVVLGSQSTALTFTESGTKTGVAKANEILYLLGNATFSGSISSISVKEVDRNNVPRIDYTGGGCPHILAEPQRTNTETKSNEFSTWTLTSNNTPTANYTVSPDGTQNATRLQFTANGFRANTTLLSSVVYTLSCFAKRNDSGTQSVGFFKDGSGTVDSAWSLTSDWVRFTYTYTTTNASYAGIAGLSGADVSVFGFQAEQGAYATSYIPTSGSAVTRNQDVFSRDGIGSLINDSEGVLFLEMAALSDDLTYRLMSISDGTSSNRITLGFNVTSNSIIIEINSSGVGQVNLNTTISSTVNFNKIALKYKLNDVSLWINGVEVATDISASMPIGLSELNFNYTYAFPFFGKVKQLQVYDTALTDMQLIQLTGTAGTDFYESYSEMAESLTYTIQ